MKINLKPLDVEDVIQYEVFVSKVMACLSLLKLLGMRTAAKWLAKRYGDWIISRVRNKHAVYLAMFKEARRDCILHPQDYR